MKIKEEDLIEIGLFPDQHNIKLWWDGHYEDLMFNNKSGELFYHSCVDGSTELYRKVKDFEDLKQAIYDGFPYLRNEYNLE